MWQVKRLASTTTQLQYAVKVPGNAAFMRPARSPIESWSCNRALDLPDDGRTDTALLEEIELLTGVIVAATLSPGRLSGSKSDEMLGLGGAQHPSTRPRSGHSRDSAISGAQLCSVRVRPQCRNALCTKGGFCSDLG